MEHSIDRGKVIAWLNEIVDTLGSFTDESEQEVCQLAKDAIALLKEQEPIEPNTFMDGFVKRYRCGACDAYLAMGEKHWWNYCPKCGKAVKWDG